MMLTKPYKSNVSTLRTQYDTPCKNIWFNNFVKNSNYEEKGWIANEFVNVHTYICQSNIRRRCIYILKVMRLGYIKKHSLQQSVWLYYLKIKCQDCVSALTFHSSGYQYQCHTLQHTIYTIGVVSLTVYRPQLYTY